jgi:hypothetical protein
LLLHDAVTLTCANTRDSGIRYDFYRLGFAARNWRATLSGLCGSGFTGNSRKQHALIKQFCWELLMGAFGGRLRL